MDKRGELNIGQIVILFTGIIVALALTPAIFSSQDIMTEKQSVANESRNMVTLGCINATDGGQVNGTSDANCNITVTGAPTRWKLTSSECALTSVTVHNDTSGHAFVSGTDYNLFAQTGIVQLLNSTDTQNGQANTTLVDYSFCGDGYNTNSGSRGIARMIGLFAMIALMVWAAAEGGFLDFNRFKV